MACCLAKSDQFSEHSPTWWVTRKAVPTGLLLFVMGQLSKHGFSFPDLFYPLTSKGLSQSLSLTCPLCICCSPFSAFVKPISNAMKSAQTADAFQCMLRELQ